MSKKSKDKKFKPVLSLNLKKYDYIFDLNYRSTLNLAHCNLIFGKNASGKTSIARCINRYYKKYSPKIFYRNKYVTKNKTLNAITLGSDNGVNDDKIKRLNNSIKIEYDNLSSFKNYLNSFHKDNNELTKKYRLWCRLCAATLKKSKYKLVHKGYNRKKI